MPKSSDLEAALLHAQVDPTRTIPAIVRHLATNSQIRTCVVAARDDLAQPIRSRNLWVHRDARVLRGERRGTWISLSLQSEVPERLRALGDEILPAEPRPASADPVCGRHCRLADHRVSQRAVPRLWSHSDPRASASRTSIAA
jgi:hypothetical protein